jgi:hypothetical protein
VLFLVSVVLSKVETLSDQVFLVQEGYRVQACAIWSLSMVTAGVTLWWYYLCNRPERTVNPAWISVFVDDTEYPDE